MNQPPRLVHWTMWGLLSLVVVSIAGVFVSTLLKAKAPELPVYGQVEDFSLTNQLNRVVTKADLRGQVWVADIIFTRCPGPCLQMTRKMKAIQDRLPRDPRVKLVSLTADPTFDNPGVLREYANRAKADPLKWHFLTGPKESIYRVATAGLKLAVQENTGAKSDEEPFIHSTRFVLVDGQGRLRGVSFEGTDDQAVSAVVAGINRLLHER